MKACVLGNHEITACKAFELLGGSLAVESGTSDNCCTPSPLPPPSPVLPQLVFPKLMPPVFPSSILCLLMFHYMRDVRAFAAFRLFLLFASALRRVQLCSPAHQCVAGAVSCAHDGAAPVAWSRLAPRTCRRLLERLLLPSPRSFFHIRQGLHSPLFLSFFFCNCAVSESAS